MYKISEIISIPVISLFESEFQGIIYNILFDIRLKKCKFACILNETDNIQKILDISEIYHIGKDCVFVKNTSSLDLECNNDRIMSNYATILNLQVYDINGKKLGTSVDIEIDKNFNIETLILNNGQTIDSNNIVNIGKSIILISNTSVNISKFKPKLKARPNKLSDKKVIILSNTINESQKNTTSNSPINKIITDFKFLTGRILSKDIKAINGEIIAKKDSVVTKEIVNRASMYGKLVEVARYSNKK